MAKFFICIATGHNVANIPSILNLGKEGDVILWIESKFARDLSILNKTFKELQKYRFSNYILEVDDQELIQPFSLKKRVKRELLKYQVNDFYDEIIFIMNGGQKSAVLGVQQAFFELKIPLSLAYLDLKPQKIFYFPAHGEMFTPVDIHHSLSLNEILSIYGYHLQQSEKNQKKSKTINQKNYLQFKDEYENNHIFLKRYHSFIKNPDISEYVYRIYNFDVENEEKRRKLNPIPWKDFLNQFYTELDERGKEILRELCGSKNLSHNLKSASKKIGHALIQQKRHLKMFERIYGFITSNLMEKDAISKKRIIDENILSELIENGWLKENEDKEYFVSDLKTIKLGDLFEDFVIYRLLQFIDNNREVFNNVYEIHTNVKIASGQDTSGRAFESDILLVFRNGSIVSLEIKAYHFTQKDLYSKIAYIRQATGLVTKSYFVLPFIKAWGEKSIFKQHYLAKLTELKNAGLNIIYFTDFFDERMYHDPEFTILSFEKELSRLLL